jgi:pyocin large subunit-like protein
MALLAAPIHGYDNARIRSSAPGTPAFLKISNSGNIRTTPLLVNTRTISAVTEVIRKNDSRDMNRMPEEKNVRNE